MAEQNASSRLVVGCMTGTSIDAIDCALVRIDGRGLAMKASLVRGSTQSLGELRAPLRALAEQRPMSAGEIAKMAMEFGTLHAEAIGRLLMSERADLICVHGQTVFHAPPLSWQLMNPWPIVRAIRTPVVYDLRGADLASGGQGAPVTPLADHILLADWPGLELGCCIVNLGGFANATVLAKTECDSSGQSAVRGFDICPCNQLLDRIARETMGREFDTDGAEAAQGKVDTKVSSELTSLAAESGGGIRSLGTGDEAFTWLNTNRTRLAPRDLAATACDAIAAVIAARCAGSGPMLLAGGGAKNRSLFAALQRHAVSNGIPSVHPSDQFGLSSEYREAMEFAVLGALCDDRVPITLRGVTGVSEPVPISGSWAGLGIERATSRH
ncbi:MAG: anhydro-N-acetylmuramic acid kinase [Phycisphaeraceae bacterium]|nr:anhydro-N-acetylmuramic acid kinase [Phycisphaeraceae bacterium]